MPKPILPFYKNASGKLKICSYEYDTNVKGLHGKRIYDDSKGMCFYYVSNPGPRKSYIWDAKALHKIEDDLVEVGRCRTVHGCNSSDWFMPSVDEVYKSMPKKFENTCAFYIGDIIKCDYKKGIHIAECIFFDRSPDGTKQLNFLYSR